MFKLLEKLFKSKKNTFKDKVNFKEFILNKEIQELFRSFNVYSNKAELRFVGGCLRKLISDETFSKPSTELEFASPFSRTEYFHSNRDFTCSLLVRTQWNSNDCGPLLRTFPALLSERHHPPAGPGSTQEKSARVWGTPPLQYRLYIPAICPL